VCTQNASNSPLTATISLVYGSWRLEIALIGQVFASVSEQCRRALIGSSYLCQTINRGLLPSWATEVNTMLLALTIQREGGNSQ
jgi:hypothetical protein